MERKKKLYWLFQVIGWGIYFLNEVVSFYIQYEDYDIKIFRDAIINMCFAILLTHIFRFFFIKYQWVKLPIPNLAIRVVLCIFFMTDALVAFNIPLDTRYLGDLLKEKPLLVIEYFINLSKPLAVWVLIYSFFKYSEDKSSTEIEKIKLKSSVKETEAKVLKAQMNPHFMFNALNSIRALIIEDPSKAQQGISQLSNILRSSLVADRRTTVSLKEELRTIEDYLALEKVRYEERLQTKWDVSPETLNVQVPPMMLQTLVENAIKHGVQKAIGWGFVEINTKIENGSLFIKIRNTGQFSPSENHTDSNGFGLKNTAQRLDILYGNESNFSIFQEDNLTVCAQIKIPLEKNFLANNQNEIKNIAA